MGGRRLGIAVLMGTALSGCYRDSDDFNAKAADYICRYNEGDPYKPFLDRTDPDSDTDTDTSDGPAESLPYSGPYCEDAVQANLSSCSAQCDYTPRKARRCLRKLKRAERKGSYTDAGIAVCDNVYECSEDVPKDVSDACRITTQECSVSDQEPPPVLFALGLLGLWFRRRRS